LSNKKAAADMTESLARMSDEMLEKTFRFTAGPVLNEMARRGYRISIAVEPVNSADGLDALTTLQIEKVASDKSPRETQ
jgi:hypothetical protein